MTIEESTPSRSTLDSRPIPSEVRQLRASVPATVDVWDASACGLRSKPECVARIAVLHMGDLHDNSICSDCSTMPVPDQNPKYVPYESTSIPRYGAGARLCRQTMDVASSPEVNDAVMASPLSGIILLVEAALLQLGDGPAGVVLDALAAVAPKKGGEVQRLLPEYLARCAVVAEEVAPMALRNYASSWYAWCFPRETDSRRVDLCGSVACLVTGVDHTDAHDNSGIGKAGQYLAAAEEGMACLGGRTANEALQDIALSLACMKVTKAMAETLIHLPDCDSFVAAAGGHVTPSEFTRARWWDASMSGGIRLMNTGGYFALRSSNRLGVFRAAEDCGKLKRAIDTAFHYNEIVDLVSDRQVSDFNEARLALAIGGGGHALLGFGDACAQITDDVLACTCSHPDHQEAAEYSMGNCLFNLLNSRFMVRQQLDAFMGEPGPISTAYSWPIPGNRLLAVAGTSLQPGSYLFTPTWQPLWRSKWRRNGCLDNKLVVSASCIDRLARRVIVRSLIISDTVSSHAHGKGSERDLQHAAHSPVTEAVIVSLDTCLEVARTLLADCDRLSHLASLRALAGGWCHVFDSIVSLAVTDPTAQQLATHHLRPLIARIWEQVIIGYPDQPTGHPDRADERLYIDVDVAFRQTYTLPPTQGVALRRAFLGVVTSAIELSGLGPYARLANGPAKMLAYDLLETP